MTIQEYLTVFKEITAIHLFTFGTSKITIGTVLFLLLIVLMTKLISSLAQRSLKQILRKTAVKREASIQIAQRLAHYFILLGGMVAGLQVIGIDLSTLFAAGAVFAVGLGFAMQNITQNFVSGVILLVEQSIKPGDILEVEGQIVKVNRMGIRSTLVRTRDEDEIIVPNSILAQGMVKNYTLSDTSYVLKTEVGVTYGSDMKRVREVLEKTGEDVPWRDPGFPPRVLMREFGDSAVVFQVFVWIKEPWSARQLRSQLNERIWWALKGAGITIAFPQLDVHFDPSVESLLPSAAPDTKCPRKNN